MNTLVNMNNATWTTITKADIGALRQASRKGTGLWVRFTLEAASPSSIEAMQPCELTFDKDGDPILQHGGKTDVLLCRIFDYPMEVNLTSADLTALRKEYCAGLITDLETACDFYNNRHSFEVGDLVTVNPVLRGAVKWPLEGEPAIVMGVLETPIRASDLAKLSELGSSAAPRIFDISIATRDEEGEIGIYLADSRLFDYYEVD